jgi:outer membrane protein TolC
VKKLGIEEFTRLAAEKDTEFETILIDELVVNYQKDLKLPAADLILSVKQGYDFFIEQDRDAPATEISLSRLFPKSGTEVALEYDLGASIVSATKASKLSFNVSQPIARNAFGRSTKLLDKIVGLEMEVARHQIVEAYEDYLAAITAAYYNWHEDYRNLEIGRSSYDENLKLLDDIRKRQARSIALPIDVNKVELQVLAKKENVLELEEKLQTSLNLIRTVVRYEGNEQLVPVEPASPVSLAGSFAELFDLFTKESRTFKILKKLEEKSSLQVERDADDLFPSINLIAGYEVQGEDYGLANSSDVISAGVAFRFPFGNQVEKAEHEVSKVLADKSKLETQNTYYRLYAQLTGLYLQIEREEKLIKIGDEKIGLAQAIVKDETENYSFGKVTLNDYIQAVNVLDSNRFNKIRHESLHRKLLIEWLRLMDQLVSRKEIQGLP